MDKDKLAKGAADNHPKRADSCVAESLKASCANSPAGVAPRSNAALEKLARDKVWELDSRLDLALTPDEEQMANEIILAALQRVVEAYENKLQDAEELEQLWHERFDESQRIVAEKDDMWTRASEQAETMADYLLDAKAEVAALTAQLAEWQKTHDELCLRYQNRVAQLAEMDKELERERMCHAACGVIAMSNTPESLAKNRKMRPEYLSASVQDCIKAAEREINLTAQLAAAKELKRSALALLDVGAELFDNIQEIVRGSQRGNSIVEGDMSDRINKWNAEVNSLILKDNLEVSW